MKLRCVFVHSGAGATLWEKLRQVRNACVDGLTGRRMEITPNEQALYVETYNLEFVRHYLFFAGNVAVGFGRVEYFDVTETCVPSLGVIPTERGKGYGREIARQVMMLAGAPMQGELFVANKVIQHIDYSLGWRPVGPPSDDVQQVECPWPPPFTEPDLDARQQEAYDEIVRYHESSGDGLE